MTYLDTKIFVIKKMETRTYFLERDRKLSLIFAKALNYLPARTYKDDGLKN